MPERYRAARIAVLRDLRDLRGVAEQQLVHRMGITPARLQQIEETPVGILRISTSARYVQAMGGVLFPVAVFEDEEISLL